MFCLSYTTFIVNIQNEYVLLHLRQFHLILLQIMLNARLNFKLHEYCINTGYLLELHPTYTNIQYACTNVAFILCTSYSR